MRQRPTLPGRLQPSTIGVLRLNFCVRNGNRWNPQAIATAKGEHMLCALRKKNDSTIPAACKADFPGKGKKIFRNLLTRGVHACMIVNPALYTLS